MKKPWNNWTGHLPIYMGSSNRRVAKTQSLEDDTWKGFRPPKDSHQFLMML